jgi:hypothetical protein
MAIASTNNVQTRPAVIRQTVTPANATTFLRMLPAWIISAVLHVVILALFLLVTVAASTADEGVINEIIQSEVEDQQAKQDLTNPEFGIDPEVATNYDNPRIEDVSVPGPANPSEAVGIANAPEAPAQTLPAPPGYGGGQGAGIESLQAGNASPFGAAGGMGGPALGNPFAGRSGATRERMVMEGGGNALSEAAVAQGLEWLALHQAPDGRWALEGFTSHAKDQYGTKAKAFTCNCTGVGQKRDTAGTAFGILPFLAAGITHKPIADKKQSRDYSKTVEAALKFLMAKQDKSNGALPGDLYDHGLATIALCEAYGLTSDPGLKVSAQKALNYIVSAQHEAGGWRYGPKQPGDTSVVGWQVMGLKSGQMAGLNVPKVALDGATKFLNSVQGQDYGYGYTGPGSSQRLTAVGLLCRQYLGWNPRKVELIKGIEYMKQAKPAVNDMYYSYYATQVMHHMGGDYWSKWNLEMRDGLIKAQDRGNDPKRAHQRGSWDPKGDGYGGAWGRVGQTSLSLLTLEVYYRHLPLYRREMGTIKPDDEK